MRRMLGAHSMVIRVDEAGDLLPFEMMPELFLGRSLRRLLTPEVRSCFEDACRRVVASGNAEVFAPDGAEDADGVVVTPVFDDRGVSCRMLVCWSREGTAGHDASIERLGLAWADLELDAVEIRFRTLGDDRIEAAPWWPVGDEGLALWEHHQRISSLGLATGVMDLLLTDAVPVLAAHPLRRLRIDVPAPEMLNGLLPVLHGTLCATGVEARRIELGVPVEIAVDPDLLPLIVHLRTLGVQIDIVGLDALTATLHTVSDTSDHEHALAVPESSVTGCWTTDPARAIHEAA